jgi:hypothetical protein
MEKEGLGRKDAGQFKIQALLLMLGCGTAMNTSRNVGERKTGFNFIFVLKRSRRRMRTEM